jgi:hypothetical protein
MGDEERHGEVFTGVFEVVVEVGHVIVAECHG